MNNDDSRPPPPARYRRMMVIEAPLTRLVGLSCRDFARLEVARRDRPLTRPEAFRHRLHGAMCGLCARFAAQFNVIEEITREVETTSPAAPVYASSAAPDFASDADAAAARIATKVRAAIGTPGTPGTPGA